MTLCRNEEKYLYSDVLIWTSSIFHNNTNENGFARAFGGAGGTCEWGEMPPQTPPLLVTSRAFPLLPFLQEKFYGE
jgi:hypothetical protein